MCPIVEGIDDVAGGVSGAGCRRRRRSTTSRLRVVDVGAIAAKRTEKRESQSYSAGGPGGEPVSVGRGVDRAVGEVVGIPVFGEPPLPAA